MLEKKVSKSDSADCMDEHDAFEKEMPADCVFFGAGM